MLSVLQNSFMGSLNNFIITDQSESQFYLILILSKWNTITYKIQLTRYASLNWNAQGNWWYSWYTQSSHCKNTGHLSFQSSVLIPLPQRSANLCPKSSHSLSINIWNPWIKYTNIKKKVFYLVINLTQSLTSLWLKIAM